MAVTGATGFIGRAVVAAMVEADHRVRALVRDPHKAADVLPAGSAVELVTGDALDRDALDELCDGASAFVHLIGLRKEHRPEVTFQRVHVDASARAVEAAKAAGVDRFILMSALGTRPAARSAYHQTKYVAEETVRQSGLAWTILRPSIVVGTGGGIVEMAQEWARGEAPPKLFMPYFEPPKPHAKESLPAGISGRPMVQPIAVGDVARAVCACLASDDTAGEVYPLGGPDAYTFPAMLEAIRDEMGSTTPVWGIPAEVGQAVACAAAVARCDNMLPFGLSDVQMSCEDNTCSSDRVAADLGFTPAAVSFAV